MGQSIAQEPKGTTIVVTGAGSGIGYAIARLLLEASYAVSAWDVAEGKLAGANDAGLDFHEIDVRDKAAMDRRSPDLQSHVPWRLTCAETTKYTKHSATANRAPARDLFAL